MRKFDEVFVNKLLETTKIWKIKLAPMTLINGVMSEAHESMWITESDIQTWNITQDLCGGNFNFGNFNSCSLTVTLSNSSIPNSKIKKYDGMKFVGNYYCFKYGLKVKDGDDNDENLYQYIKMGTYICTKCKKEESKVVLELNDLATIFDVKPASNFQIQGKTLKNIVEDVCIKFSISYNTENVSNFTVNKSVNLEGISTYRQLLSYIAQLSGCNIIMDEECVLRFIRFHENKDFTVDNSNYSVVSRGDYSFPGFGALELAYNVTTTDGDGNTSEEEKIKNYSWDGNGYVLTFETNPLYNGEQEIITQVSNNVKGIKFHPCSFTIDINPLVQVGDKFEWTGWEYEVDSSDNTEKPVTRTGYITSIEYSDFKQVIECADVENNTGSVGSVNSSTTSGGSGTNRPSSGGGSGTGGSGGNINVGQIIGNAAFFDYLKANFAQITFANITQAVITNAMIKDLEAGKITAGTLGADVIYSGKITTDQLKAGNVQVGSTMIEDGAITTEKLNVEKIELPGTVIKDGTITTQQISSDYIYGGTVKTDQIIVGDTLITGDKIESNTITGNHISGDYIYGGTIVGDQIKGGTISGDVVYAGKVSANNITAGELQAGVIFNGTISSSTTVANDFKLGWGHIKDVTIDFADVGVLNADILVSDAIKASEISADQIRGGVLNLNKGIKIAGGLMEEDGTLKQENLVIESDLFQMYDDDGYARVQIGKDKTGKYSMVIWNQNEDGTYALFDSTKGGIQSDGIPDKIVTPDKIEIGQLCGDSLFIEKIQAMDLKADQITTGVLKGDGSGSLRIEGLVSFESLNDDMSSSFNHKSNGTSYRTYIDGNNITTGSVTANKVNLNGLTILKNGKRTLNITDDGDVSLCGDIYSDDWDEVNEKGYRITKDGLATFNNATIRGNVILPNAGITNVGGVNPVRMWAGCSYDSVLENKDNAPFYVTQEGSLYARKGNFGGTFTGKLEIGNIRIEDTTSTEGQISIRNNGEIEKIRLSADNGSYINTNIKICNFGFNSMDKEMTGYKTRIRMENDLNSIKIMDGYKSGKVDEFHILDTTGGYEGKHEMYYQSNSPTLNIRGGSVNFTTGNTYEDRFGTRKSNDFELNVEGSINVAKGATFGGLKVVSQYVDMVNDNGDYVETINRIDFLM